MKHNLITYKSPVGDITCVFEGASLVEVCIATDACGVPFHQFIAGGSGKAVQAALSSGRAHVAREFDAYFKGELKEFTQNIKFIRGTCHERKIWLTLKEIPYGEVRTYKWIASRIGNPQAMRAVGQALKRNPLPIILPCHRVISSDGTLGGFSCGVPVKKWLLRHEFGIEGRAYALRETQSDIGKQKG
ncbi:MAG: methylated-DNA--[protein]-cysteine S-methyltransferase [Dissulfurispiraceae bacterium]